MRTKLSATTVTVLAMLLTLSACGVNPQRQPEIPCVTASKWSPATVEQLISESDNILTGVVTSVESGANLADGYSKDCNETNSLGAKVQIKIEEEFLGDSGTQGTELTVWWAPDNLPFDVTEIRNTLADNSVLVFLYGSETEGRNEFYFVSDYGLAVQSEGKLEAKLAGDTGIFFDGYPTFDSVKELTLKSTSH